MVGQTLVLNREPDNCQDRHAVTVLNNSVIVSHVPYNLTPLVFHFLTKDANKAFAELTGEKVNRAVEYGLKIPCIYHLYGSKAYVEKVKEQVDSLHAKRLL